MTTHFTTFLLTLLALLVALASSAPVEVRDVFVPPVSYPHAGTIWRAGSRYNVTWDISNPPKQITNAKGMVVLAKGPRMIGLDNPMAKGFNILDGHIEVTLPTDTVPGDDYSVVLFGDSGNNSKQFTVISADDDSAAD